MAAGHPAVVAAAVAEGAAAIAVVWTPAVALVDFEDPMYPAVAAVDAVDAVDAAAAAAACETIAVIDWISCTQRQRPPRFVAAAVNYWSVRRGIAVGPSRGW